MGNLFQQLPADTFLEFHNQLQQAYGTVSDSGTVEFEPHSIDKATQAFAVAMQKRMNDVLTRYARLGVAVLRSDKGSHPRTPHVHLPWALIEDALAETAAPPSVLTDFLGLTDKHSLHDPQKTIRDRFFSVPEFLFSTNVLNKLEIVARYRLLQRGGISQSDSGGPQIRLQRRDPDSPVPGSGGTYGYIGQSSPASPPLPDALACLSSALSSTISANPFNFYFCLNHACTLSLVNMLEQQGPGVGQLALAVGKLIGASVVSALGISSQFLSFLFGGESPWGLVAVIAEVLAEDILRAIVQASDISKGVCIHVIWGIWVPYVTTPGAGA